jgi:hypothetical protein
MDVFHSPGGDALEVISGNSEPTPEPGFARREAQEDRTRSRQTPLGRRRRRSEAAQQI